MINRVIPSSGEEIPAIGLGTWKTFDVRSKESSEEQAKVLEVMHDEGAKLIDSSPMYGNSEKVIGDLTSKFEYKDYFFYATKVWTTGKEAGIQQMESSFKKMKRDVMDLMQIHNLVDWKTHLQTLRRWKSAGRIRYIGITHYVDSAHEELQQIITNEKLDFVQFNYSILSRNAEKSLLPTCADKGVAVLINKPFGTGNLFSKVKGKPLPDWAKEFDIDNWADYFLKYIISHPAVTCAIPATADPSHASDNLKALKGKLPDSFERKKMVEYLTNL